MLFSSLFLAAASWPWGRSLLSFLRARRERRKLNSARRIVSSERPREREREKEKGVSLLPPMRHARREAFSSWRDIFICCCSVRMYVCHAPARYVGGCVYRIVRVPFFPHDKTLNVPSPGFTRPYSAPLCSLARRRKN
ncbi:hypothetical protein IWX91DRAFT_203668 [Phyllosticta citricarpa]